MPCVRLRGRAFTPCLPPAGAWSAWTTQCHLSRTIGNPSLPSFPRGPLQATTGHLLGGTLGLHHCPIVQVDHGGPITVQLPRWTIGVPSLSMSPGGRLGPHHGPDPQEDHWNPIIVQLPRRTTETPLTAQLPGKTTGGSTEASLAGRAARLVLRSWRRTGCSGWILVHTHTLKTSLEMLPLQ